MKSRIITSIWRLVPMLVFSIILSVLGCGSSSYVEGCLDDVETLMENRPDSALSILDSIDVSDLSGKKEKARFALLKSMALDKNYVDTTTFNVLQPAIDYYFEKGSPDEKLRTYYYQGRIYQNRSECDRALRSFLRGLEIASECKDSLMIVKTLVAQGILYHNLYDFTGYINSYFRAADILNKLNLKNLEFDCLLNSLGGLIILKNKERADSLINILNKFEAIEDVQQRGLERCRLSYIIQFGTKKDLMFLDDYENDGKIVDINVLLNICMAYNKMGDNKRAQQWLDYLDKTKCDFDTLKYLSIKYQILEDSYKYEDALIVYKDYINRLETLNSIKFEQMSNSMEEKHRIELQAEKDARKHAKTIWELTGGIAVLILLVVIMFLAVKSNRTQKGLALQKARNAELENENLKAENELANQKARTAELENENLKTEKEKLALENRNLQLECDNKALEAENLAHRVSELESESDNLKELLQSKEEMPEEVQKAIKTRIEMLNSYLASQISDHKEFEKAYDTWVAELTANTQEFMDSNRLAFQASHPAFIKYFEDHDLTESEINYVCLYAIGLRGKDVGNYMRKRSHVNISSAIRKKLGIDKHDTNIGIYVRKLLKEV